VWPEHARVRPGASVLVRFVVRSFCTNSRRPRAASGRPRPAPA